MDMSEYRVIHEERQAEKQKAIQENMAAMDYGKLDKYKKVPRNAEDDFVSDVAKFNGVSDKDKPQLETALLVYGRVVQAHHALYTPQKDDFGAAGIVLVFALDEAHRYDEEWLAKTANCISEMKKNASENKPKGFFFTLCRLFEFENNSIITVFHATCSNLVQSRSCSLKRFSLSLSL
jgi:hypothetical protein